MKKKPTNYKKISLKKLKLKLTSIILLIDKLFNPNNFNFILAKKIQLYHILYSLIICQQVIVFFRREKERKREEK